MTEMERQKMTEEYQEIRRESKRRRGMYRTKYEPQQYREWLTGYIKELAPDFFGWLEDINLEEYCLGDDTAKYCRDKGIPAFEEWVES